MLAKQGDIRFEVVKVCDLIYFMENFFRNSVGQVMAPISRRRAIGMAHNPFADSDDPGLIVAYDREKVIAHYCLVPGFLETSEGRSKVIWGSALYVHPSYRSGGQVFLNLIRTVFSFETDFVISGFTEDVHQIYKALDFREPKPLETCTLNISKLDLFGSALWLARDRGKISESLSKLAARVAPAMRLLVYRPVKALYFDRLARVAKKQLERIRFCEVQRVQARAETPRTAPHFVRGTQSVNWMLEYPWIAEGAAPTDPPYYFFDYREEFFRYYAIEFDNPEGELAGYLTFSIQSGAGRTELKLTDFSVRNQKDLATVFWIAALYAARHGVDHFEAAFALHPFMIQMPFSRFLVRSGRRHYLCHLIEGGALEKVIGQLDLQYGDGDCAFT